MDERSEIQEQVGKDVQLVGLVSAALSDPNLHTDLRMRLSQEIATLLRTTHDDLNGPGGGEVHQPARDADETHLPGLLQAVLADPNLHTDMRMRLHREIPEMVVAAHRQAQRAESTASPLAGVTVLDAMNPGVVVCLPDDTVAKIASIMATHGIHAVLPAWGDRPRPRIVTDLEVVPFNLRPLDQPVARELGNRFGLVLVPLPVGVSGAYRRLHQVHARMQEVKRGPDGPVSYALLSLAGLMPEPVQRAIIDLFSAKATAVVTNVPGPRAPVHLAGTPVKSVLVWAPTYGHLGTSISIFSYRGGNTVGLMADAALVPEPNQIVGRLKDELAVLATVNPPAQMAGAA